MNRMEIFIFVIVIIIVFRYLLKISFDVKLSKEYIFVLDKFNPCLHLFSYNHILQKSVISRGIGMTVINPCFFFIDQNGNILISDRYSNSILIFNTQFQLFHKIPVSDYPVGVTVDNQGRVIVVSQSTKHCLQIFFDMVNSQID